MCIRIAMLSLIKQRITTTRICAYMCMYVQPYELNKHAIAAASKQQLASALRPQARRRVGGSVEEAGVRAGAKKFKCSDVANSQLRFPTYMSYWVVM